MRKVDVYHLLEAKVLGYLDYHEVPVCSNGEPLVRIQLHPNLECRQIDAQMVHLYGNEIYVRQSILEKLCQASAILQDLDQSLNLEIVSGYRTLEIQTQLFEKIKSKLKEQYSRSELLAAVHRYVAVPEVAGHPTGGAVDVQLTKDGQPLDFGTKIWEFVDDSLTFSPFISQESWKNRQFLRYIMMTVGFAPFDGEWWHFSYGDKEWAKYFGKSSALYEQLDSSHYSMHVIR